MKPAVSQARTTAVWGGMASYLDAATIVSASIAFVFYKLGGLPIDAAAMGILAAALTLGLAVGALVGGRLGDLYGRRRVFSIDLLVFVSGLSLLTFGTSLPAFYVGVTVTGLAMGADLPVSIALVGEAAPQAQRGRMVSL
ncbi:MAG: MFS transporter, partial [Propionibacteriaceae bacterium]|nr:MFS transporter [Propionibacteriaceae bacterium]